MQSRRKAVSFAFVRSSNKAPRSHEMACDLPNRAGATLPVSRKRRILTIAVCQRLCQPAPRPGDASGPGLNPGNRCTGEDPMNNGLSIHAGLRSRQHVESEPA
jgi:hypothetical protein